MRGIELRRLPDTFVVDTGPLLLPLTREPGWRDVRRLIRLVENRRVRLLVGLFNLAELLHATRKLGYEEDVALEYARLVARWLDIVDDVGYAVLMGRLRAKVSESDLNVPWGDISSAAAAIHSGSPALALDGDAHFDALAEAASGLNLKLDIVRVGSLRLSESTDS